MNRLKILDRIEELVLEEPRTIEEIARELGISWATARKYAQELVEKDGRFNFKTINLGRRRVNIVYFQGSAPKFLDDVVKRASLARDKLTFPPTDLFFLAKPEEREVFIEKGAKPYAEFLSKAKEEVLIFSGNLSFVGEGNPPIIEALRALDRKGVRILILSRIDIGTLDYLDDVLALKNVEIRHREQPFRGVIRDRTVVLLREERRPDEYPKLLRSLLGSGTRPRIYYKIYDRRIVRFLARLFFTWFKSAQDVQTRKIGLEELSRALADLKETLQE